MAVGIHETYTVHVRGRVPVPRQQCHENLYTKDSNGTVYPFSQTVYTDVPGEVSYEDEATVTLIVDGEPFDRSVENCADAVGELNSGIRSGKRNIGGLTSGVEELTGEVHQLTGNTVAAGTGITGAKVAAAHAISSSLVAGFSKYISYLVKEKLMDLSNKIPSLSLQLKALCDSLRERKDNLRKDYERITARYETKIQAKDNQLKSRLIELDRPAYEDCKRIKETVFKNPLEVEGVFGETACAGLEQLQTADTVRIATAKNRAFDVLRRLKENVKCQRRFVRSLDAVMHPDYVNGIRQMAMPVIVAEIDDLAQKGEKGIRVFMPEVFESAQRPGFGADIGPDLLACACGHGADSAAARSKVEIIDRHFRQRLANFVNGGAEDETDVRMARKILELWEQSAKNLGN